MRTFSARGEIKATSAELWPLIGDLTRHAEWSADPLEIGAIGCERYVSRATSRGKTFTAEIEVLS